MALVKPSYNTKREVLGEKLPLDTPFSVILDPSERCNFKCSYCFRSGQKSKSWGFAASGALMSTEIFECAAQQLKEFPQKIKLVSLTGQGEPLCNPDIADMVRYLKELDVAERIDMHTNASLLTEENAIHIARAGFTCIVVSLQGLNASEYEHTCKAKIDFQRFYNNLKILYENKSKGLKIHIKIEDVALDKDNMEKSKQRFYELFGSIADSIFVENAVPLWNRLGINSDAITNKFGDTVGNVDYCPLLFYKMLVAPDGEIYPCTNLPSPMSLGNISNITLREAWSSRKRLDFLKEHLRLTRHKHEPCEGCFVPVNTVTSREDIIDPYKDSILKRLKGISYNG